MFSLSPKLDFPVRIRKPTRTKELDNSKTYVMELLLKTIAAYPVFTIREAEIPEIARVIILPCIDRNLMEQLDKLIEYLPEYTTDEKRLEKHVKKYGEKIIQFMNVLDRILEQVGEGIQEQTKFWETVL